MRHPGVRPRFAKSFSFNNAEALIRIPILALMVETWHISAVARGGDHPRRRLRGALRVPLLVVYAPRKPGVAPSRARHLVEELDARRCRQASCGSRAGPRMGFREGSIKASREAPLRVKMLSLRCDA